MSELDKGSSRQGMLLSGVRRLAFNQFNKKIYDGSYSLERVDRTNDLAHMELFLAGALIRVYDPVKEKPKYDQIRDIIERKKDFGKILKNCEM